MRQHIEVLRLLPKVNKPLDSRLNASKDDRRHHWSLGMEYFDGSRHQGYGGYRQDDRWVPVAKFLIDHYSLDAKSKILELGCAKGFLMAEIAKLLQGIEIWGVDISHYALSQAIKTQGLNYVEANFTSLPFKSNFFDLVISINSIHNILTINETILALKEIQRVSRESLITVGAYNNLLQKQTLDSWAVVASCYLSEEDWLKTFERAGFLGDYDWFIPIAETSAKS